MCGYECQLALYRVRRSKRRRNLTRIGNEMRGAGADLRLLVQAEAQRRALLLGSLQTESVPSEGQAGLRNA